MNIQDMISDLNRWGYDQISVRASILEATCYVYDTKAPLNSPSAIQFTSSSIENAIRGAYSLISSHREEVPADEPS